MYVFIFFITKLMNYMYVLQMFFVYWLTVILFTLANSWWTFLIALFSLLVARQLFLYWLVHIPSVSHHWSKMLVILLCHSMVIEVISDDLVGLTNKWTPAEYIPTNLCDWYWFCPQLTRITGLLIVWVCDCTLCYVEKEREIEKELIFFFYILSIGGCLMLIVNC